MVIPASWRAPIAKYFVLAVLLGLSCFYGWAGLIVVPSVGEKLLCFAVATCSVIGCPLWLWIIAPRQVQGKQTW